MKIPEAALNQHIAVLGKTRSGKTNSAKLVIEKVAKAGSRVCVIDPIKADYWGLTSSADGKRPGLPFHIIGGNHAHVPLHASAGPALADVVASGALRLSIIDMEHFGPREAGPFFAAFMERLFRKIEGVLYLVVDEAHLFAPKEKVGDEAMSTYWFKRMASGSGSKGVRLIVSTQRVQDLHNTILSNCDTVIAHRVTYPEDQKRIAGWAASHASKEMKEEVERSLPNLQRGEAWICSGEAKFFEKQQLPLCETFDNSRTPAEGDKRASVKQAPIDLDALRAVIGDAVKEAEANDPKKLRARIAELEAAARKKAPAAPPPAPVDVSAIERRVRDGMKKAFAPILAAIKKCAHGIAEDQKSLALWIESFETLVKAPQAGESNVASPAPQLPPMQGPTLHNGSRTRQDDHQVRGKLQRQTLAVPAVRGEGEELPTGEAAVLRALIQYPHGLRREQLTVLTGYKRSSRDAYISRLKQRGFASENGLIFATTSGHAAMPDAQPLPTGRALQEFWLARLPEGERKILEVLISAYDGEAGSGMPRDTLGESTGYKRSSRDAYLSRLASKELIVSDREGVRASETLFEGSE